MGQKEEVVLAAQNKVRQALGENYKLYLNNLLLWFRGVWTKEQFDLACRKLFQPKQTHLHNEFVLVILNKITIESQEICKRAELRPEISIMMGNEQYDDQKSSQPPHKRPRVQFEPMDLFDYLPSEGEKFIRQPDTPFPQPRYAAQEIFLPDIGMVFGRLMVTAWENGLLGTGGHVCELIVLSVHTFLKNVLTAIIRHRKNYRTTAEGRYIYDIGQPFKDPILKNTVSRQIIDEYPIEIDKEVMSTITTNPRRTPEDSIYGTDCDDLQLSATHTRITLIDVYNILQDRNIIPCHSVYALNMERISHMLN